MTSAALLAFEEGLDILRALVAKDPGNNEWQRDLSLAIQSVANLKLRAGDSAIGQRHHTRRRSPSAGA